MSEQTVNGAADGAADGAGVYDADLAGVYDAIYLARGKDYAAEAADVAALVTRRLPTARSLLDVACGTGSHLRHFGRHFAEVAGLELSTEMLAAARAREPAAAVYQGDMRTFDLGRVFDSVTCMFSSIAYMADQSELDAALARMAHHVVPGGVVVVEPWWFPETFLPGYVAADVGVAGARRVARVSHTVRVDGASRMEAHYLVADPEAGVRHFVITHVNTLFDREQYETAFERAGLGVEYLPDGPSGRGLFVGVRR